MPLFGLIFPRIVALAEPPQTGTGKGQWLSPEILSMFLFHHMRSLSHQVITVFIRSRVADPDSSKPGVLITTNFSTS
jgi:hypothetical protein